MSAVSVLQVTGLCKSFKDHRALEGINLSVSEGETVCILGPSGAGKSTLLRCINWLEAPDSGAVFLSGERVGVRTNDQTRCRTANLRACAHAWAWCSSISRCGRI